MTRNLRLAAAPGRLLLLLAALLFLSAIAIQLSLAAVRSHHTGAVKLPAVFAPASGGGQPVATPAVAGPASGTVQPTAPATTRTITGTTQPAPFASTAPAATNPAPAEGVPSEPGCGAAPPLAAPGIASHCPNG